MENKTAVEWLVSRISHGGLVSKKQFNELAEQAKQLEKEQIEEAYEACCGDTYYSDGEHYYKETFKSE